MIAQRTATGALPLPSSLCDPHSRAERRCRGVAPDRKLWEHGHKLFVQAFSEPSSETEKKKLLKLTKRALPAPVAAELFSYEGFLRGLGRMNISACAMPKRARTHRADSVQTWRDTAGSTRYTRT
jgi:hypothetical protein